MGQRRGVELEQQLADALAEKEQITRRLSVRSGRVSQLECELKLGEERTRLDVHRNRLSTETRLSATTVASMPTDIDSETEELRTDTQAAGYSRSIRDVA